MKLKNVLIATKDMERSVRFYHDLFGLSVILDNDGNRILTEGLVLQDTAAWIEVLGREIIPENNSCELYFEERDIEGFVRKLEGQPGVSARYVDIPSHLELCSQRGICTAPAVLVYMDDHLAAREAGVFSLVELLARIERYMAMRCDEA